MKEKPLVQPERITSENFDLYLASQLIEQIRPKQETQKWKYEGDRLTIEEGDFDYDISVLSASEETGQ